MERRLKGFRGVVGWRCLSVLVGLVADYSYVFVGVSLSIQSQQSREGFGHFVSAPPRAEEDDQEADLDGGLYTG